MVKEITNSQLLRKVLADGALLIDVRENEEVEEGALNYDDHWPLSSFGLRQTEISKTRPTIFYCRSGVRSFKAAEIASEWTDQPVYTLGGGYLEFKEQNSSKKG